MTINQFLAHCLSKIAGLLALILLAIAIAGGFIVMSDSLYDGLGVLIAGCIGIIAIFGPLMTMLAQYEETKRIRKLLESQATDPGIKMPPRFGQ